MTEKKFNKVLARPLALTAGILGFVQGIVWTIFSVLCVCCYSGSINVDLDAKVINSTQYDKIIYLIFLKYDDAKDKLVNAKVFNNTLINSKEFFSFMCFYVVFSVIWLITSGVISWAMIREKWNSSKFLFGGWSLITILTSIVDIVLTGLIASDYDTVNNNLDLKEMNVIPAPTLTTYGIVMSLVARGYLLWIINVIFAVIMAKFTVDIFKNENQENKTIINAYDSTSSNPPWMNGSSNLWVTPSEPPTPKVNDNINDDRGFTRSQSFFPALIPSENKGIYTEPYNNISRTPQNNNYISRTPQNNNIISRTPQTNNNINSNNNNDNTSFAQSIAEKVATIGKNKGRPSPLNPVSGPYIPDPDYTPPGSPTSKLKSVLRSKSNYK